MRNKQSVHVFSAVVFLCFIAASCSKEPENAAESKEQPDYRTYTSHKLGLSIRIPENWRETSFDDDRFAVGEDRAGGAAIVFTRESSGSLSKKYPNLPRLLMSKQLVQVDAMQNKLIEIGKITIAGYEWYFAVKEVVGQPTVRIMRVFFWNDADAFSVSAVAHREFFEAREPLFKVVLESISFEDRGEASREGKPKGASKAVSPSEVANIYIDAWIKRDFAKMWAVCNPKPLFMSQNILERSMKSFLIPVREGKVLYIKEDKNNSDQMLATYVMEGPTLGCILCIIRGAQPSDYSNYLQIVDRVTDWHGTLTISKLGGEWKIIDDTNPLIRTIYLVHAKSLLDPSTTWYDIVVGEAMKRNMEVEEFMDKHHPEMLSCCEELNEKITK